MNEIAFTARSSLMRVKSRSERWLYADGKRNVESTMTKVISPNRLGLVMAALIGGVHFFWAAIVAVGWAQPLINVIFWLHFIRPIYIVSAFDWRTAALLVSFTALIGYGIGSAFALLWNRLQGVDSAHKGAGTPLTQH